MMLDLLTLGFIAFLSPALAEDNRHDNRRNETIVLRDDKGTPTRFRVESGPFGERTLRDDLGRKVGTIEHDKTFGLDVLRNDKGQKVGTIERR